MEVKTIKMVEVTESVLTTDVKKFFDYILEVLDEETVKGMVSLCWTADEYPRVTFFRELPEDEVYVLEQEDTSDEE